MQVEDAEEAQPKKRKAQDVGGTGKKIQLLGEHLPRSRCEDLAFSYVFPSVSTLFEALFGELLEVLKLF